jgi:hypothetical protein
MKSTLHVELAVGLAPGALPGSTIPRGSGRGWRPFLADRVEQQLRGRRRPSVRIVPATSVARARVSGVSAVLSAADRDSVVGVGPSCAVPMPRLATRPAQYG